MEQLGAVLSLSVDDRAFQAGLLAAIGKAERAGERISKVLEARQGRVSENQTQIVRLQREALTADAARSVEIQKQIKALQQANKEQQLGISTLKTKLTQNQELTASLQAQAKAQASVRQSQIQSARGFASALTGIGGLTAVGVGVGLAAFFRQSIDAAVELESITKKLTNTLGQDGAGQALTFTRGVSDKLGLSFKTLASTFSSFTAAASAANVPLKVQQNLFAAVSKAAQQLGLSNDEINGSLLALQQVASKGTVQMEELRGQLGERLPIAFAATAQGLGITQTQLIKLVESGKLTATEFFPALTKGLNELTSASGNAPTTAQNFAKLGNAWDQLQTSFGQNLIPTVTSSVEALIILLNAYNKRQEQNKFGLGGITGSTGLGDQVFKDVKRIQQQFKLTDDQIRALFFDAAKLSGLKIGRSGFFPDAEGFEQVLKRLPKLAEEFRAKNKGSNDELRTQASILGQLTDLATKKSAKQSAEIEQIKAANKLVTDSRRDIDKAYNLYLQLQDPKLNTSKQKLEDAASLVEKSYQTFRENMVQGAKQAAEVLINAANSLTEARQALAGLRAAPDQGLNAFLTPQQRQVRLNSSIGLRGKDLERAISVGSNLLKDQGLSFNSSLLNELRSIVAGATGQTRSFGTINGKPLIGAAGPEGTVQGFKRIDDFISAVFAENKSKLDLAAAEQNMIEVNKTLGTINEDLAKQVKNLAEKNWQVYVNVDAGGRVQTFGEVLNTAVQ